MNVDSLYPTLSSLVWSKMGIGLNELGRNGNPKTDKYWTLQNSCWSVLNDQPRWKCDPIQYLKTLDEFVEKLTPMSPARRKVWDKVSGKGSAFLDTVVEAAWALYFWDNLINAEFEQRFDQPSNETKDADIEVSLEGTKYWLDATSIALDKNAFPIPTVENPFVRSRSDEDVIGKLSAKAREKYENKFGKAVRAGFCKNDCFGVLLCILKSESIVLPVFDFGILPPPPPPSGLLDTTQPGLNLVWVHTLDSLPNSESLRPLTLAKWQTV